MNKSGKAFIDTIVYNYSLETENRIANFVVSMQANFALCNKKTSFSEKKEVFLITVLVVDDHELVRTGICRMLEDHPDVDVVGQDESGEKPLHWFGKNIRRWCCWM